MRHRSTFAEESNPFSLMQIWVRNSVFNEWNIKQLKKQQSLSLLYSAAELFINDNFNLSHLFKIPYLQLMDIIYAFSKDIHVSYSEFNDMPWYEVLMLIDKHNDFIDKQNSDTDGQNDMIAQQQAQMNSMYQKQQQSMPKFDAPNMPSMPSMPNMSNFTP